jgi:hypothetical protein
MRDLGVFTSTPMSSSELVELVRGYSLHVGQPFEKRPDESVVGSPPNVLYVSDATAVTNGYFSEDEAVVVESALGSAPMGYISIHFTNTDVAFRLAEGMAQEIRRLWHGVIDYGGAGGSLGMAPVRASTQDES